VEKTGKDRGAAGEAARRGATKPPSLSLERMPLTLVDRWLPAKPARFLTSVIVFAALLWVAGLLLAGDKGKFLASPDWQLQPLYLATHVVVLRLFVTAFARNFLEGCARLEMPEAEAQKRVRRALGPWGWICALALAAPFAWFDVEYLVSQEFLAEESTGPRGVLGASDWLLGTIWTLEWVINAYVWVMILAFLFVTMRVLKAYRFREDLEVVLGERHYRPFLLMSAQGASIVLGFSIITGIYVWHAEGETTDYLGFWITAILLIVCFVPPWLRLKNGLARLARVESDRLNREIRQGWESGPISGLSKTADDAGVVARLNLLLTMARAGHFERLYRDFGKNEGQAMLIKLLAPLSTVIWKIFRPG
jgi:hypothetical protein